MWGKESQESFSGEEEEAYAAAEWRFFLVGFCFLKHEESSILACLWTLEKFLCPLVQQLGFGFVFGIRTSILRPLSLCCWFQLDDCGLVSERSGKCRLLAKFCASKGMWNNNNECAGIAVPYRLSSANHQEATSSLSRFLQTFFWSTTLVRNFFFVNDIHHLKHKNLVHQWSSSLRESFASNMKNYFGVWMNLRAHSKLHLLSSLFFLLACQKEPWRF